MILGRARSLDEGGLFHKVSLIAFLAWVGLGVDGLSSSCYGPEEAFRVLHAHPYLSLLVAAGTVATIFIISASYSQIIELFPSGGGGGYLVASKLLSPTVGMVAGCALLIDYVLTIAVSVASGCDALFSFLSAEWQGAKLIAACAGVVFLVVLNLRGVRESVLSLLPAFLLFVVFHAAAILYGFAVHISDATALSGNLSREVRTSVESLGLLGTVVLVLRAYAMGAGTFTGIEAVSTSVPILREPRVETAHRTMRYMAISLSVMVFGLLTLYALYEVEPQAGRTLNAVLFSKMSSSWHPRIAYALVSVTLMSEAMILFIAAQTGFIGGPRILANMAVDRWVPTKFAILNDRFVTQNGILLMGGAALGMMTLSRGSVHFLVVLYSINVFVSFTLAQLGMVRHAWASRTRDPHWATCLRTNGAGFVLTSFILLSVTVVKFKEGGYLTLLITGGLVVFVSLIRRHYADTAALLSRLDDLVLEALSRIEENPKKDRNGARPVCDTKAPTAVVLVNGFTGFGLRTVYLVMQNFHTYYRNYVFVQIGVVDAGSFKGKEELARLEASVREDLSSYVELMRWHGYHAESYYALGTDVVEEVGRLAPKIIEKFPHATFFGGQLVFRRDFFFSQWLHNYTVFAVQRNLYQQGIPVFILPVKVPEAKEEVGPLH